MNYFKISLTEISSSLIITPQVIQVNVCALHKSLNNSHNSLKAFSNQMDYWRNEQLLLNQVDLLEYFSWTCEHFGVKDFSYQIVVLSLPMKESDRLSSSNGPSSADCSDCVLWSECSLLISISESSNCLHHLLNYPHQIAGYPTMVGYKY